MGIDSRIDLLFVGGDVLIDLGCGDGLFLDAVAPRYARAVGFDVSTTPLEHRSGLPRRWEFVRTDLNDGIPLEAASASAALANQVIEHLMNPLAFAFEVRRVLKPGGIFVVATPNVRYVKHLARLVVGGRGPVTSGDRQRTPTDWDGGHIHFFTPTDLTEIMLSAGFSDVSTAALIDLGSGARRLRRLLDRSARLPPVREFLSGNTLLVARA